MPNIISYDTAHDIVHSYHGNQSATCPLCNGSMEKKDALTKAGEIIEMKNRRGGGMMYSDHDTKEQKGSVQFFVDVMKFSEKDGELPTEIQLVPIGEWNTAKYGKVTITKKDLDEMVKNFNDGVRKGVMLDIDHGSTQYGDAAAGWIHKIEVRKDGLWATEIEYTPLGKELLSGKVYKFMSPEFNPIYEDPEDVTKIYKNVLVAGSLVNRPLFKNLKPLMASEQGNIDDLTKDKNNIMLFFEGTNNNLNKPMPNLKDLVEKTKDQLDADELKFITAHESELTDEQKVKFGIKADEKKDDKTVDPVKATEGTVTIKASELEAMKAKAEEGSKALKMLERKEIEGQVEKLLFNDKGIKLPVEEKSKVVEFMETLTTSQRKTFSEILEKVPTREIFNEEGNDADNHNSASELNTSLDKEAKKIQASEKEAGREISYKDALEQAAAKPEFANYQQAPSIT